MSERDLKKQDPQPEIDFSKIPTLDELRGIDFLNNLLDESLDRLISEGYIDDNDPFNL